MRFKIILLLVFLYYGVSYSQLNELTVLIKENDSLRFSYIEEYSKNKWNTESAIQFEINKQSEGFIKVMRLLSEHNECQSHKTIIAMEMLKYSSDSDNFSDANWWRIYQEIKNRMD